MPSPSASVLRTELAVPFTVEGGFNTNIVLGGEFNTRMASGMDTGWTSATPTTPSSFQSAILAAFSGYTLGAGQGLNWITCIGTELDAEVDLWIASWQVIPMVHTYVPSAGSIIGRIQSCELFTSNARTALDQTIADTFIKYFEQEVG